MSLAFALGFLLAAGTLLFVGWPLFAAPREEGGSSVPAAASPEVWERQKLEAYRAIKEAEFDFQMGKLDEADFRLVRERYAAKALEAIAALEQLRGEEAPARPQAPRVAMSFCPQCGSRLPRGAKFCPGCGLSLAAVAA